MEDKVKIDIDGEEFTAEFCVNGDTLIVILPDGTSRTTELRGLMATSAARTHLKSWVQMKKQKEQ